ncbi:MAG: recombinase [Bacteroidetes bacterium HGW-Bacteroidetes-7]|jgi:integrase|nr:MAG: recombinase [Bacteroidetes bacterium HGW-Bacteroidetes-7]
MATVTAFIRVPSNKKGIASVRFRLRDGEQVQLFYKSRLKVNPSLWDNAKQEIKAKVVFDTSKKAEFHNGIAYIKNLMLDIYANTSDKKSLTSEKLQSEIEKRINPDAPGMDPDKMSFMDLFDEFIQNRKISDVRKNNFRVLFRALQRFELYKRLSGSKWFAFDFDSFNSSLLGEIEAFLKSEHKLAEKYKQIYEEVSESRKPAQRGQNTINDLMTKFRTFFIWANNQGFTKNNPFTKFSIEECVYGTPYYITIAERNHLHNTDFSARPQLGIQKDIFVFQCLIGCRVGDLYKMTRANIINGAIEYIPRKTKDGRPITVRVPLNTIAREILDKYKDYEGPRLFPFISGQKYNDAIKDMFAFADLTRVVTVINPKTRLEEKRPINEVASSHLARRCFVGNLYKQVKDPNLVGVLTGHKEGSKAFNRYREIDEDIKIDLVKLIE